MISYKDFSWKKNKLFLKEEDIKVSVVPDKENKDMFRIKWGNKEVSDDFYNKSRAMDNALCFEMACRNTTLGKI